MTFVLYRKQVQENITESKTRFRSFRLLLKYFVCVLRCVCKHMEILTGNVLQKCVLLLLQLLIMLYRFKIVEISLKGMQNFVQRSKMTFENHFSIDHQLK